MAESKKADTAAASSKVALTPAGESGDPAVHQLLAELEVVRANGDADGVKAAIKALADLGVEAS